MRATGSPRPHASGRNRCRPQSTSLTPHHGRERSEGFEPAESISHRLPTPASPATTRPTRGHGWHRRQGLKLRRPRLRPGPGSGPPDNLPKLPARAFWLPHRGSSPECSTGAPPTPWRCTESRMPYLMRTAPTRSWPKLPPLLRGFCCVRPCRSFRETERETSRRPQSRRRWIRRRPVPMPQARPHPGSRRLHVHPGARPQSRLRCSRDSAPHVPGTRPSPN